MTAFRSLIRGMNDHIKSYLANQLRLFRRQAKLTQEELAAKINRTGEAISNIERGKSIPSVETLVDLSEMLSVPLRDFFPTGTLDDAISKNRMALEAEAATMLRGLTDAQLHVALAQIKALEGL